MTQAATPTMRRVTLLWLPLAATWLMMAVEGPLLAALIARMPEAKLNLAAFGVAFSLALIIEAPIIMMLSASTALVRDRDSYVKLWRFSMVLNIGVSAVMVVLVLPPVFRWLAGGVMGLPDEVVWRAWIATALLLPWPGAIGFRRFYNGVAIRQGLPRIVVQGTVLRILTMAGAAFLLMGSTEIEGSWVAAIALSCGVTVEAVATRFLARKIVALVKEDELDGDEVQQLSYPGIAVFYWPLALTSILALGTQPVVTFFLGHSKAALDSLAVQPVIGSLLFIFRSLGLAFQEVGIALMGDRGEGYQTLRRFATWLGLAVAAVMALIAWTPLATIWFGKVSGLSPELVSFCETPLRIAFVLPALTVLLSWQRAQLVHLSDTAPITWASSLEILGTFLFLMLTIYSLDMIGAVAAAISIMFGRLVANLYLALPLRQMQVYR